MLFKKVVGFGIIGRSQLLLLSLTPIMSVHVMPPLAGDMFLLLHRDLLWLCVQAPGQSSLHTDPQHCVAL